MQSQPGSHFLPHIFLPRCGAQCLRAHFRIIPQIQSVQRLPDCIHGALNPWETPVEAEREFRNCAQSKTVTSLHEPDQLYLRRLLATACDGCTSESPRIGVRIEGGALAKRPPRRVALRRLATAAPSADHRRRQLGAAHARFRARLSDSISPQPCATCSRT